MITVSWSKKIKDDNTSSKVDRFMNANSFYETYGFGGLGDFSSEVCANFEGRCEDSEKQMCRRVDELAAIVGHDIDITLFEG